MQTLLRKWWIIMLQGILLILLSIIVFNNPAATLVSLAFWMSILILGAGIAGLIGWLMAEKDERLPLDLIWSLVSVVLGIVLLAKIGFAMTLLTTFLGLWMVFTGFWLAQQGWAHRSSGGLGWATLIAGILSIIAGLLVVFNLGAGAVAVSTLVGMQLLIGGLGLIVLSLIKKKMTTKVKNLANAVKSKLD